jgi:hypothetical protein
LPCTDARTAKKVLDRLQSAPLPIASLRESYSSRPSELQGADIDLVVGIRPKRAVSLISHHVFAPLGLQVVCICPTDSGLLTVLAVDSSLRHGVHLDLAFDRIPTGRLGLKFQRIFDEARTVDGLRCASARDEALYLARKRHYKRQVHQLIEIVERIERSPQTRDRIPYLLTRQARRNLARARRSPQNARFRMSQFSRAATYLRFAGRALRPRGHWVHVAGSRTSADQLSKMLAAVFPTVRIVPIQPGLLGASSALLRIQYLRRRPAVVLTAGARLPRLPSAPDHVVRDGPQGDLAPLVSKLSLRSLRR